MKDILNQFVENLQGQFVEVSSKEAIFQCMDLAYVWVFCLGIPKSTIKHTYAYQVFTSPNPDTSQYFDVIPNSTTAIPEDGDLVIWSNKLGVAGHIAIALGGGSTSKFMCFEQNNPIGSNAHISERSYTNVLGWLRPKFKKPDEIPDDEKRALAKIKDFKETTEVIRNGNYEGAANAAVGAYRELEGAKTTIKTLESFRDGIAQQLNMTGEKDTSKIVTELVKHIKENDEAQKEAGAGLDLFNAVKDFTNGQTWVFPSQVDDLISKFKDKVNSIKPPVYTPPDNVEGLQYVGRWNWFSHTYLHFKK